MSALNARIVHIECVVVKYFDCLISILFAVSYGHILFAFRISGPSATNAQRMQKECAVGWLRLLAPASYFKFSQGTAKKPVPDR